MKRFLSIGQTRVQQPVPTQQHQLKAPTPTTVENPLVGGNVNLKRPLDQDNNSDDHFGQRFRIIKKLGNGGYCNVYKAIDLRKNDYVAIKRPHNNASNGKKQRKTLEARSKERFLVYRESSIMFALSHENILKLHEVYENYPELYLVLELASGGELFDRISLHNHLSEAESKFIIRQVINGVVYMHTNGFLHRDLKPENILFKTSQKFSRVLIADFGFSTKIKKRMFTICGTIDYSAPEIIKSKIINCGYSDEIDIWAIGVITYVMLSGHLPFYSNKDDPIELRLKIIKSDFKYDMTYWQNISKQAIDFINNALITNPAQRLKIHKALKHDWFLED